MDEENYQKNAQETLSLYQSAKTKNLKEILKNHTKYPKWFLEETFSQNAEYAFYYARDVIKYRWLEAEEVISKDSEWAYAYAYNVIKGRWPKGEEAISKDAECAYLYAKFVIKGRFELGEEAISKCHCNAYCYARDVIGGRWPKGEEAIINGIWPEAKEDEPKDAYWLIEYANFLLPNLPPIIVESLEKVAQGNISQENKVA